jgi:ribosome-binding protein aMBF1 (putative translation factor)
VCLAGSRGERFTQFRWKGEGMKTKKCPVCAWEIKDEGIPVKVGGKEVTVCCDECAQKLKQGQAPDAGADR